MDKMERLLELFHNNNKTREESDEFENTFINLKQDEMTDFQKRIVEGNK